MSKKNTGKNGASTATRASSFVIAAYAAQFFFGGWFVLHGLNYWMEFFPRPTGSSPIAREVITALIDSGLFSLVKALEVGTGLLMLANRFVPLAIVAAFPIALSIAHLNILSVPDLTGKLVGLVIMALLGFLAVSRLHLFLPMLASRSEPDATGLLSFLGRKN